MSTDQTRTYDRESSVVFLKTNEKFGGLSNMAGGYPLLVNGVRILTSEALYQACRFPHLPDVQRMIIGERSPMTAKMKSKPYRQDSRPDWDRVRVKIMRWCLRVKLAQNWRLFSELLLETGDQPIVEESRKDDFWGANPVDDATLVGMNVLGRLLMELREAVKTQDPASLLRVEPLDIADFLLNGKAITAVTASDSRSTGVTAYASASGSSETELQQPSLFDAPGVNDGPPPTYLVQRQTLLRVADLKPYPLYRDTDSLWLGQVPQHWDVRPAFGAFEPNHDHNHGMKEKTVLSLSYGRIVIKPTEKLRGLVPESFETYQIVNPGDIVLRTTDLQNDHTSLRVGMVRDRGIITSAYLAMRSKSGVLPSFAFQLLNVWDASKAIYGYGSGLRQNLDFSHFKRMPVAIPPPDEQAAIVRFLDWATGRLERAIRAKRKVIALLNEQKQAIIHHAVTRGLDPNVALKPSGIPWLGDIPEHWEFVPLKSLCKIQSGITLGKDYGVEGLQEFPYLRVANVQAGRLNLGSIKTIRVPLQEAKRSTLQRGDVLMTEGGDPDKLGRGCVWNAEVSSCLHQNHVFAVRPRPERLLPEFLSALLGSQYAKQYFLKTAKQTTNLASTNKTTIGQFRVVLPSVDEQSTMLGNLATIIDPVTTAISRVEREIELLREYRTRLVADVVTGKLDVREAAARLPDETPTEVTEEVSDEADEIESSDEEAAA